MVLGELVAAVFPAGASVTLRRLLDLWNFPQSLSLSLSFSGLLGGLDVNLLNLCCADVSHSQRRRATVQLAGKVN